VVGVAAPDLPALTADAKLVVTLAYSDGGAAGEPRLLVFEAPRPRGDGGAASPGRGRLLRDLPLLGAAFERYEDVESKISPTGDARYVPTAAHQKTLALLRAANALLAGLTLRSFDAGPERATPGTPGDASDVTLAFDAATFTLARDANGNLLRARGQASSGAPFALDFAAFRTKRDGATLDNATFALDLTARLLLVNGHFMSVNTWFPANETTFLLSF